MEIYTIGYSSFQKDDFIAVLKEYGINSVIDVRSSPYSAFHTDYNKEILQKTLKDNNIFYRNYKNEFGARQTDRQYYPEGYLSFSLFVKSEAFQSGMNKIINAIPLGYTFALMCSEKDPLTCHRTIMVAREFHKNNIGIKHILSDKTTISQEDIENRLVKMYFSDRDQVSFFGETKSFEELVDDAYEIQNRKIGYRFDENNEGGIF